MVVDISGDMQPDLIGLASENGGKSTSFKSWRNTAGAFTLCVRSVCGTSRDASCRPLMLLASPSTQLGLSS